MANIDQVIRFKNKNLKGDLGIEIEVEGENLPYAAALEDTPWYKDEDPSLRGESAEYILRQPVLLEDLRPALHSLKEVLNNSIIKDSYRAGIHVHLNVRDLSVKQMFTLSTIYFTVEELIFRWFDKSRSGNHFCLSANDAEYLIHELVESLAKEDLGILNTDKLRYSGLNFKSLFKHGSLEFRGMESTMNFDKLITFCEVLYYFRDAAKFYNEPVKVIESFSMEGYEGFLSRVFGVHKHKFLCKDYHKLLRVGIVNAQELAYARDWNVVNNNIFRKNVGAW